jgi:hypothetical protein
VYSFVDNNKPGCEGSQVLVLVSSFTSYQAGSAFLSILLFWIGSGRIPLGKTRVVLGFVDHILHILLVVRYGRTPLDLLLAY